MQRQNQLKVRYFLNSALKVATRTGLACPSCGCRQLTLVKRKYIVTSLRRCAACRLLFRTPTTNKEENERFYQRAYQQGFTTEMPPPNELRELKRTMFKNSEKDYSDYIAVLNAMNLKPGAKLLDYGCSWGYGSWQLQKAGFSVQSYEISRPRCEFAKQHLGLNATWDIQSLQEPFGVFFSAHVLEHVPSVKKTIDQARQKVRSGGYFVAFTPNGSGVYREVEPWWWERSWGLVHPNLLDEKYYRFAFRNTSFFITSSPYDLEAVEKWMEGEEEHFTQHVGPLTGPELLVVARI